MRSYGRLMHLEGHQCLGSQGCVSLASAVLVFASYYHARTDGVAHRVRAIIVHFTVDEALFEEFLLGKTRMIFLERLHFFDISKVVLRPLAC